MVQTFIGIRSPLPHGLRRDLRMRNPPNPSAPRQLVEPSINTSHKPSGVPPADRWSEDHRSRLASLSRIRRSEHPPMAPSRQPPPGPVIVQHAPHQQPLPDKRCCHYPMAPHQLPTYPSRQRHPTHPSPATQPHPPTATAPARSAGRETKVCSMGDGCRRPGPMEGSAHHEAFQG